MQRLALLVLFLPCLLLLGCGDDPILAPTTEAPGGGSYGRLGFESPVVTPDSVRAPATPLPGSAPDTPADNPRRF
ncbi:MAG: hypothetical protein AAGI91_03195 [Bacteroidota bacterium]